MPVESIIHVSDFNQSNPPSGDQVAEGDDHIRAIKRALQTTFPSASKPFYLPSAIQKATSYSILQSDQNKLIFCNTAAGAITLTLPSIVSDDGWMCRMVKWTVDLNPVYVVPPSGTLQSGQQITLTKTRRAIPGIICEIIWTGGVWFVQRALALPIGSPVAFWSAALPFGYEWCNGQSLSATDYPDYNPLIGSSVPDLRGRAIFGTNTLGTSASPARISSAGSGIAGDTLGAVGGTENVELSPYNVWPSGLQGQSGTDFDVASNSLELGATGTVVPVNKMPPTLIMNYAVVVE